MQSVEHRTFQNGG